MEKKNNPTKARPFTVITWFYFILLFGWLTLYLLTKDTFGYLGVINSLAVYLFFPLPLTAVVAAWTRRRDLIAGTLLGAAAFLWFWGPLFTPSLLPNPGGHETGPMIKVMTYNVLGKQEHPSQTIDVIQSAGADLVFIQELNPPLADAVHETLSSDYPYQILDPQESAFGMGTISRYPLRPTGEQFPLKWIGVPQVIIMDFEGESLTLLNFHTYPLALCSPACTSDNFRYRESQAQAIADFVARTQVPLIAAGDANATHLSDMVQIIRKSGLKDTWWETGFGMGHTFPGSDLPESDRPQIMGWAIPKWLARIDYIFVSPHWQVENAILASFDGVSDHRGVVVELVGLWDSP